MNTPNPNLPEPARVLVGEIIKNQESPLPGQVNQAIDILRMEITQAQGRLDAERRRLPHLAKAFRDKKSRAFLGSLGKGTVKDREAMAEIASLSEKFDVEVCEQAIQAGREYADALKTSLSAVQSIGGLLRAEMSALGSPFGGQG